MDVSGKVMDIEKLRLIERFAWNAYEMSRITWWETLVALNKALAHSEKTRKDN
jgi:hypothetical protein